MHREPLPGPLDINPAGEVANLQTARLMLGSALEGLPLGAHDRQVIGGLTGTDVSTIATVASWLRRATVAGLAAGRAEQVDEIPVIALLQDQSAALMEAKDAARAEADDAHAEVKALARQLDAARASLERVNGWWRDAQAERDEARQDVEGLEADLRVARADCARVVDGLRTAAEALQHEAAAERDRLRASLAEARAEALAGDHDRNALTRIVAAAVEIEARFDAERVSAQGAFERLLAVITEAGGAAGTQPGRISPEAMERVRQTVELVKEAARYRTALAAIEDAVTRFRAELGGLEPSGVTAALLAAIEDAIGGAR